ncbi:AMP-binding protein [Actinomadura sp. SCN-SB]|uniref:AMP-binding protein n=1 Tax=Actinomadura sp. SCN-SB TaxID=3373092 RepID=UPI00375350F0
MSGGSDGKVTDGNATDRDEILRRRAELEREPAGRTVATELASTAERHGGLPAYSDRGGDGEWHTLTWGELRHRALETAAAFAALGLVPGDVVALMMPNRSEHVLADLGAMHAGGTPTTVYATLAADQIAFVAADCAARYAVLDGRDQLDRWLPALDRLPGLSRIIVVDVVALITLDGEVAPVWAAAHGLDDTDVAALASHPAVLEEVGRAVEEANARLARVQQVKKWRVLPAEWTAESEELTPTLKLRRRIVHSKYTDVLDTLYAS